MLLQRLVQYAERTTAPPFHRARPFNWQLNLTADGELESAELLPLSVSDAKGRLRPVTHVVPHAQRSGIQPPPSLAADDAIYVLGWADDPAQPAQASEAGRRHAAFQELVHRWATSAAGRDDPVAQAVDTFYCSGLAASVLRPDEATAKSGVLIAVAGVPAYQAPSVPAFWSQEVARRKGGSARRGLCLACGQIGELLDTIPGNVPASLIPGAANGAALVSINEAVFGYDLVKQLSASPLCVRCGEGITAGLIQVLGSPQSSSLDGQDSRLAWWTTEETPFDAMALLQAPSEADVAALLATVHAGQPRQGPDMSSTRFCSLTVGGNVARIMVRDWLEMPLEQLQQNLAQWFLDQRIASTLAEGPEYHGIARLTRVTGRWITAQGQGRYADLGARGADRPVGIHRDLIRAALRNQPVPPSHLAHLVHRVRSDGRLDDARAALIRLLLTRSPLTTENPMPGLDPDNANPAYVAGRVFAVLDQIQYDVSGGQRNTTYADRFFAGAISNPRAALVSGQRDAVAWLRKLRRTKKGAAVRHERALDELFALLGPAGDVPARTTLTEQSLFLLGYHHQRAQHFAAARAASATRTTDNSEESDQ